MPLSIASAPQRLPEIELHYRSTPGSEQAGALDALLAAASSLQLRGPFGDVKVEPQASQPLLLVAGGTGASQALSIVETLSLSGATAPVTLLACADSEADFYFRNRLASTPHPRLQTHLVVDKRRNADNAGLGWLRARAPSETERIILCGSPAFVYAAADALTAGGCEEAQLESDVFAYAPRS